MKRITLLLFLVTGLTLSVASPAQAIFGLSTCEKVKKQVLQYESKINAVADYWNRYLKKEVPSGLEDRLIFQVEKDKLIYELNKIQYNNPKCFTRTQNEWINQVRNRNISMKNLVQYVPNYINKSTPKCQDVFQKLSPSQECIASVKYKITIVYSWQSIYEY